MQTLSWEWPMPETLLRRNDLLIEICMSNTAEQACLEDHIQKVFSLFTEKTRQQCNRLSHPFPYRIWRGSVPHTYTYILMYLKNVYVCAYVYPCIFIRIIQAGKDLWRWLCLMPRKPGQLTSDYLGPFQWSVEPLQAWRPHNLSGHLFWCSLTLIGKNFS